MHVAFDRYTASIRKQGYTIALGAKVIPTNSQQREQVRSTHLLGVLHDSDNALMKGHMHFVPNHG